METLIKYIQKTLEEGKPTDIKASKLASKALKEINKEPLTS